MVAWSVVSAGMAWGLLLSSRRVRRRGGPAWQLDLHKFLGTSSLVFTAIHLAAIVADNFVHFGLTDLTVPMASDWRPGAVAWGIVATYLLAAVQITSWLLPRLPRKVWHAVHLGSFGLFATATTHGFTAGTEAGNLAVRWAAGTLAALVRGDDVQRFRHARRACHARSIVSTPVRNPLGTPVEAPVAAPVAELTPAAAPRPVRRRTCPILERAVRDRSRRCGRPTPPLCLESNRWRADFCRCTAALSAARC